jgi:hypothetical protein
MIVDCGIILTTAAALLRDDVGGPRFDKYSSFELAGLKNYSFRAEGNYVHGWE